MVKMIPDLISEEIKSQAERKLFSEFKNYNTKDNYIILHSLALAEHVNNIFGEIDFLVICSRGILCLEIKGGSVECNNGRWTFANRYGKMTIKSEGPFQQVQGNMQSLRAYLSKRLDKRDSLVLCQYASGVIMPDITFTYRGIEVIPEILFDKSNYVNLTDVVQKSFDYWENKLIQKYGFAGSELSSEDMERLANLLRGDFRFVPSMKDIIDNTVKALCVLTDEQYDILESLSENERTLVAGVAGAGKTFLAMEQARRIFWTGKNVLYVCFNRNIAGYVQYQFEKENIDIRVSTLHSLIALDIDDEAEKSSCYYEHILPQRFLQKGEYKEYDYLIVDEGQDIFREIYLECLDKILKGGLRNGCWCMLYDQNQNIYNGDRELNSCISKLKGYSATYKLSVNCRNTKQIADANMLMTAIPDQGRSKISGLKVDYIPYESKEEEHKILDELLLDLKNTGIYGSDIVILSKYSLINPNNCLYHYPVSHRAGILKTTGKMWQAEKKEIRFSTIYSFKGLEAKTVIIMDIDDFSTKSIRLLNYVAISRASSKLYVLYDKAKENERQMMICEYYSSLQPKFNNKI